MSDEILRSLYQKYTLTHDPDLAIEFMEQYMRQIGAPPILATARNIDAQTWLRLAKEQRWGDPESIVNSVYQAETPFTYGYQCCCGAVFLASQISDVIEFEDWESFGRGCDGCDQVYACGSCKALIHLSDDADDIYLCKNCFIKQMERALDGNFSLGRVRRSLRGR